MVHFIQVLSNTGEAGQLHHPKGGERMPVTVTFHVFGFTVTIRIKR